MIAEKHDVCILLLSPLNSFFTEENIKRLAEDTRQKHKTADIYFMINDTPLENNFIAIGYPYFMTAEPGDKTEDMAETRARKYSNQLKNKAKRAAPEIPILTFSDHILMQEAKENNATGPCQDYWCSMCEIVHHMFQHNKEFRQDCIKTSMPIIEKYAAHFKKEILSENLPDQIGCFYLLDELAAFVTIPQLLQDAFGLDKSTIGNVICMYPNPWPIFEKFISGGYDNPAGCAEFPNLETDAYTLYKAYKMGQFKSPVGLKFQQIKFEDAEQDKPAPAIPTL